MAAVAAARVGTTAAGGCAEDIVALARVRGGDVVAKAGAVGVGEPIATAVADHESLRPVSGGCIGTNGASANLVHLEPVTCAAGTYAIFVCRVSSHCSGTESRDSESVIIIPTGGVIADRAAADVAHYES